MGEECERCGISREDTGFCEWINYGGQELCEECYDNEKHDNELEDFLND